MYAVVSREKKEYIGRQKRTQSTVLKTPPLRGWVEVDEPVEEARELEGTLGRGTQEQSAFQGAGRE